MSADILPTNAIAQAPPPSSASVSSHPRLGQLAATAISGNDITSSCLYTAAIAIAYSGIWAPVALLLVAGLLYLYRSIYTEVVEALPLNGGAYNALLNTTSKFRASMAACLTLLSYMTTAVVSASTAMYYVKALWEPWPVLPATVGLLFIFTVLTIIGITESAKVAVGIFIVHLTTLTLLLVGAMIFVLTHGFSIFMVNLHTPAPGGFLLAIFFGFCAALLGVSGFETSANYVEEQAPGVFPKTLRNMWIAVIVFNPLIALLALCIMRISDVASNEEALLAHMGFVSSGHWLGSWVSINAALVLSGAVLTSFVGVNGLIGRLTLDRCLPQFLLKKNRRGTTHRITIAFFILSVSVLFITRGNLKSLAGVYAISFLSVMALFGGGNMLLKIKRAALPRPVRASWPTVIIAVLAVILGLLGNAIISPDSFRVFLEYFIPTALVVIIMLKRVPLMKGALYFIARFSAHFHRPPTSFAWLIREKIQQFTDQQMVFFTRGDNIANLNRVMLYVLENESTNRIKIVNIVPPHAEVPENLEQYLKVLGEIYPEIDIELVVLHGKFCPQLIHELSEKWNIPPNFMFIGSPSGKLPYALAELGGVRLIV